MKQLIYAVLFILAMNIIFAMTVAHGDSENIRYKQIKHNKELNMTKVKVKKEQRSIYLPTSTWEIIDAEAKRKDVPSTVLIREILTKESKRDSIKLSADAIALLNDLAKGIK